MTLKRYLRAILMRGVFWRHFLTWAVVRIPFYLEPLMMWGWSLFFFILWTPGRRAVQKNLVAILPRSPLLNFFRTYRVFLNYAWTLSDKAQFSERRKLVDWELSGAKYFDQLLESPEGAVIITAHMGNYDLGAYFFSTQGTRPITIVRVPEDDPDSEEHARRARQRSVDTSFSVTYNTDPSSMAIELTERLGRGEIVAIQGDRVVGDVAGKATDLFGMPTELPLGPFALAMATRVLIYPLFVVRVGRRRYRVIVGAPIRLAPSRREERETEITRAMSEWKSLLESVVQTYWFQWFTFTRFYQEDDDW